MSDGVVAVMQPYFFPYAGYYRLLAAAETFVVFDDAQFTRRGRVHRCEVAGHDGKTQWLTLPLARQPQNVAIGDLKFADEARATFDARLARLPWLARAPGPLADRTREFVYGPLESPSAFLVASITFVATHLALPARIVLASELGVAPAASRAERIVSYVRAVGGHTYLNAPGGRRLYTAAEFEDRGIALRFLDPYNGGNLHMLEALVRDPPSAIRDDIFSTCAISP